MYKVRITVMKRTVHQDLIDRFELPQDNPCEMEIGQSFIAEGDKKPEGLCESAWETLRPFVIGLENGEQGFYGDWMKDPRSAMLSCNDGFRPVSFLVEAIREDEVS